MEPDTYLDATTSRPSESSDGGKKLDAKHFRQLRKSRKLSQQWVANKCDCSISLISKWEKGACSPSGEIMRRIARTALKIEELPVPGLKYCWKCQTQKQVSLFGRDRSRPNGLQSRCLECNHTVTKAWRKANKKAFADRKRVKYKIKTSGSRQAGYKWVNGDKRSLQEIQLLGAKDELSLRKGPFRCSPIKKSEKRKEAKLLGTANQILVSTLEFDDQKVCPTDSYLDVYGRRIKQAFESGQINEEQSRKLARHISNRSPVALERYWKTLDVSTVSI
jgi:transcriptional regulator with XRE-family HTH domain